MHLGDPITGRVLRKLMGRAQRRAKVREETKRERSSGGSPREPSGATPQLGAEQSLETQEETARRIYRAGGKPKTSPKTRRQVSERRLKWREGRQ